MAAYFGLDPTLVRVLWVIALPMGWGLPAYLILWIVLPKGPGSTPAMRLAEERYARGEISAEDLQRIRLQPANGTMDPILVDKVDIQGVVVGVFRKL